MRPVPERQAAKAAGQQYYETGKPCRNGHIGPRYTSTGICVACGRKNVQAHYAKHIEGPEQSAARQAGQTRYETGRPCRKGHLAQRYTANGRCVVCTDAANARWRKAHPGAEAGWARTRRAKNPHGHRKASLKWALKNPEKHKALSIRWKKANPERARELARAGTATRRAKVAAVGGRYSADDVLSLRTRQRGKCATCGQKHAKMEVDHILPIYLGGKNNPANLQLLCRPCNRSKGRKHPLDFARSLGMLV